MLTAVTSHVRGLPAHQGTSVRPSGLFPSRRVRPTGSLVAGMLADEKALKMTSFRAWCLVVLPGACLHTKLWRPRYYYNNNYYYYYYSNILVTIHVKYCVIV